MFNSYRLLRQGKPEPKTEGMPPCEAPFWTFWVRYSSGGMGSQVRSRRMRRLSL